MDILVKVSGSLVGNKRFYDRLLRAINPSDSLFILCGGGAPISEALIQKNIPFKFGPEGREIESREGRILAYIVLEKQKLIVERNLQEMGVKATVIIPATVVGDDVVHVNGDEYVKKHYDNFDKIFVITLNRAKTFSGLPKIEVVYL